MLDTLCLPLHLPCLSVPPYSFPSVTGAVGVTVAFYACIQRVTAWSTAPLDKLIVGQLVKFSVFCGYKIFVIAIARSVYRSGEDSGLLHPTSCL
jgi:hypothetical protein